MLKERTTMHTNVEEKMIYPEIKAAQDMYVLPILGTALFDKILTEIDGNTLQGAYKTLVDDYLVDMLCYYTLSEMPENINYQFSNRGVVTKQSDNAQVPSMSDLYAIVAKYKNRAEHYQKAAIKYLKQNAPTLFPEYINPGSGIDTVQPDDNAFSNPIYLGDDDDCSRRSYSEKYQGNNPSC